MVKPPKIRFQKAYRPIFPAHLDAAPVLHVPKLPPLLPFFKLKTHTVPTKWSLYRPLLKATYPAKGHDDAEDSSTSAPASLPGLRRHIRARWKKARQWTSIWQTRDFLAGEYDLLSTLTSPSPPTIASLRRRDRSLHRLYTYQDARKAARAAAPRPKARLVGGYIYPTAFNPPLPRLKPQPPHISGMISRRIAQRERRLAKMRLYKEYMEDMAAESRFEERLGVRDGGSSGFEVVVKEMIGEMNMSFEREKKREAMKFSSRDVERVERARKDKFRRAALWRRERARGEKEAEKAAQATTLTTTATTQGLQEETSGDQEIKKE